MLVIYRLYESDPLYLFFFFLMIRPPPSSTLFPYPTLSRSDFLVPVAALTAWLTWQLWSEPAGSSRDRFARLGRLVLPFALGAAGPILVFLAPYALSGSLGAVWAGVFIVRARRFRFATMDFPALWTTLVALAPAALLWRARHWPTRWRQRVALVLGLGLLAALVYGDRLPVYRGVWYAARPLVPLTVLAGVAQERRRRERHE